MDALNVLNHPTFAVYPNNAGGADFMGAPSTATLTTAAYNTWAAANNQPLQSTTAGAAIYNDIVEHGERAEDRRRRVAGELLHRSAARRISTATPATSYDITTLQGYKYYQLRNAYSTNFGTLYNNNTPRYIQFGVKFYW